MFLNKLVGKHIKIFYTWNYLYVLLFKWKLISLERFSWLRIILHVHARCWFNKHSTRLAVSDYLDMLDEIKQVNNCSIRQMCCYTVFAMNQLVKVHLLVNLQNEQCVNLSTKTNQCFAWDRKHMTWFMSRIQFHICMSLQIAQNQCNAFIRLVHTSDLLALNSNWNNKYLA